MYQREHAAKRGPEIATSGFAASTNIARKHPQTAIALGITVALITLLALGATALCAFLFATDKSAIGLWLDTLAMYAHQVGRWPEAFTGHGLAVNREALFAAQAVAGQAVPTISHNHNDWLEIAFAWDLPALVPYAAIWCLVLRATW